jgi:hypothetical protein
MEQSRPLGLRGGLRRLSRGLIAYGIIGLVVAAIGFGALVWVNGRVSSLRAEVETTLGQRSITMALAATVLHDASTTAQSFSATVDQSAQAVSSAAGTITEARSSLTALEAQLRSVNILGATPLSSAADAVGRIAASMDGLDTRVSGIAEGLKGNRDALAGNATSIGRLGDSTAAPGTCGRPTTTGRSAGSTPPRTARLPVAGEAVVRLRVAVGRPARGTAR